MVSGYHQVEFRWGQFKMGLVILQHQDGLGEKRVKGVQMMRLKKITATTHSHSCPVPCAHTHTAAYRYDSVGTFNISRNQYGKKLENLEDNVRMEQLSVAGKASELNHRRDLQEVQLARISHIQFTYSSVSALDICLTSFGDTRTVSARIADQADYGLLNPARNCGSG
ncbi:hypothetical protein L3X38_002752 [Prunus dulcis]|uniref:Smr domain-containing protein n=1 Tax=Prunus dulcis TaxID=3755 RepID=A0AAD4WYZ5_PRUDU|nr:hypothetical protein L3X38_002752 [Prunus dulcis]